MSNEDTNAQLQPMVPAHVGLKPLGGSHYAAQCTRCNWIGSSAELTKDAQCTRIEGGSMCLGDTDEVGADHLLGIIQAMSRPVALHRDEAVAAKVIAYTPGMAQVELKLSNALPQWLELGEQVVISTHAELGDVERLRASEKALAIDLAKSLKQQCTDIRTIDALRSQLGQRDALLRTWLAPDRPEVHLAIRTKNVLSASAEPGGPTSCTWTYNEQSFAWGTSCSESFTLMEDGPHENGMKFCPYCSKPINQTPSSEEQSEGGAA